MLLPDLNVKDSGKMINIVLNAWKAKERTLGGKKKKKKEWKERGQKKRWNRKGRKNRKLKGKGMGKSEKRRGREGGEKENGSRTKAGWWNGKRKGDVKKEK